MGLVDWMARRSGYVKPEELPKPARSVRVLRGASRVRRFEAGRITNLNADVPATMTHINDDLRRYGPVLVARARWLRQNDGYVRRFLQLITNNVLGAQGLRLSPAIPNRGNTEGTDEALGRAVVDAWSQWGRKGSCESTGRLTWNGLQRAVLTSRIAEGEAFVLLTRTESGLLLQHIDNLRIPLDYCDHKQGRRVVMGVELDESDCPVAYYVQTRSRHEGDLFHYAGRTFQRIDASRILHLFEPEFAEQIRGFSPMVAAMRRIPMLDGYEEAALVAARLGASKAAVYERSADGPVDIEGEDGIATDEEDTGELIDEITPGGQVKLPHGWKLNAYDPAWPNVDHAAFLKPMLRSIAASLGVSYTALASDLEGVNLSSIRHGMQEDREAYKALQQDLTDDFARPVYDAWLPEALRIGAIRIGDQSLFLNDANLARLSHVHIRGRRWEFPEPLKDAQAHELMLSMRGTSISQMIRDRGQDPEQVWSEIARDHQRLAELGIPPETITKGQPDAKADPQDEQP